MLSDNVKDTKTLNVACQLHFYVALFVTIGLYHIQPLKRKVKEKVAKRKL